eukprot:4590369-Amphidinium_carterae.1
MNCCVMVIDLRAGHGEDASAEQLESDGGGSLRRSTSCETDLPPGHAPQIPLEIEEKRNVI